MFVRSWSNSDRGTPGRAAIGRDCNLNGGERTIVVVVLYIEVTGVFTRAVVNANHRDIAEALACIGNTTVETSAAIGGELRCIDRYRCTPGFAAIGGFGHHEGSGGTAAVTGWAIGDAPLPCDIDIASFVSGNVTELVN